MFTHGLVREKTHMRTYSRICTRREKSPGESISCETTIRAFLYCAKTERVKKEHEMGFSGLSGRI